MRISNEAQPAAIKKVTTTASAKISQDCSALFGVGSVLVGRLLQLGSAHVGPTLRQIGPAYFVT